MAFTKSRRSSRRFRFVTRSRSSSAPANKKSRFGAMIRRCRKAKTILSCVRRTFFSKKRRSPAGFRSRSKRRFHTAPVWVEEAATLLPLCWRSTNCLRQIYPVKRWRRMAEMIGSDVPFFIFQSAAVCKGRGELVTPTRLREQLSVLLLKPGFGVPTQWAYSRWRDSREIPGVSYGAQQFTQQSFVNDLERPVFEKFVFLGATENVVTQATRSRCRADVRLGLDGLRRDSR